MLSPGDLGVQRGVIRWFLSLHSPSAYPITISPEKLPKNPEEDEAANGNKNADKDESTLPVVGESSGTQSARASTPDASSILPAPATGPTTPAKHKGKSKNSRDTQDDGAVLPTPFTPSINKTLNIAARDVLLQPPPPLPEGLTPAILRSRLNGKNKIKCVPRRVSVVLAETYMLFQGCSSDTEGDGGADRQLATVSKLG